MNQKLNLLLNISKLIWFKEVIVHWFTKQDKFDMDYYDSYRKFALGENHII